MNSSILNHVKVTKRIVKNDGKVFFSQVPVKVAPPIPLEDFRNSSLKSVNTDIDYQGANQSTKQSFSLVNNSKNNLTSTEKNDQNSDEFFGSKFDFLIRLSSVLDEMINLFLLTGRLARFPSLKPLLENILHSSVKLSDIQKIVYISPEHYVFERMDDNEIAIRFPKFETFSTSIFSVEDLEDRKSKFKKLISSQITSYSKSLQSKDLRNLKNQNEKEDFEITDLYFDSLSLAPLPTPLISKKIENMNEINSNPDKKESGTGFRIKLMLPKKSNTISKLRDDGLISKSNFQVEHQLSVNQRTEILRNRLISKVQLLEQELKKSEDDHNIDYNLQKKDIERIFKFCENIKFYFTSRKIQNAFLIKVLDYSSKSQEEASTFKEGKAILDFIVEKVPGWLRIFKIRIGEIVRIDHNVSMEFVSESLNKLV